MVTYLRLLWLAITGNFRNSTQLDWIIFMADIASVNAAIASLNASADRVLAKANADATALAQANADLSTTLQPIQDSIAATDAKLTAFAPVV
jgi:hypothetical protein